MKNIYLSLLFVLMGMGVMAQGTITGTVVESDTNEPIIGALVKVEGTTSGAVSDLDGAFSISGVDAGTYNVTVSSVGYQDMVSSATVADGQSTDLGNISLSLSSVAIQGIEIIADVAIDRKTPVAVSNVAGDYIAERTGNQELTETLSVSPSVYASQGTGGFGDSRLTVRGFTSENVVVMVNGVPVNDMENQVLFWSNWAGLADVASQVQIQRGLGATQLAVPSIGGTINIITKATDNKKGGWFETSVGNDQYRKYGLQLSTGKMANGWAITAAGSRTTGDGYVDGNFIDAYSWFGSITKDWKKHSLVFAGFGAPQRHGQGFRRSLSTFVNDDGSRDYADYIDGLKAEDVDGRGQLRDNVTGSANSIRYNSGWGYIGRDVNNGFTSQSGIFNQFSNFYHKPQASLTHYWDAKDNLEISTAVYGSVGRGGGASSWGRLSPFSFQESSATGFGGPVDWRALENANVANNPSGVGEVDGNQYYLFRASMNHHQYAGLISKLIFDLSDELQLTSGVDGRIYSADHIRKIIDGFGLTGLQETRFPGGPRVVVPDSRVFGRDDDNASIFNRDNTGNVNWMGAFSELEYNGDKINAALGFSASNKSYQFEQRYFTDVPDENRESDWYNFLGGTVKGGVNYNLSEASNIFVNAGYLSVQPIFDNVFLNGNNGRNNPATDINEDAENEKVLAFEAGYGLSLGKFAANLNVYRTSWQDKAFSVGQRLGEENNPSDPLRTAFGNTRGIDALHQGVELELKAKPTSTLTLTGSGSIGDWNWESNSDYQIYDDFTDQVVGSGTLYLEDVKVGGAPQSQIALGATHSGKKGLGLYGTYRHFMEYYSSFDTDDRQDPDLAGVDSNQLPDYGLFDAGISYDVDLNEGTGIRFYGNLNNLFDNLYINEAREDVANVGGQIQYGDLSTLIGNFGRGRTWNAGAKITFKDGKKKVKEVMVPEIEPVVLDRDGDGVLDDADKCPDTPGTIEGCPDSDGDGVVDSKDDCVDTPGLASNSGCPEEPEVETVVEQAPIPDADGDGLLDNVDKCPNEAGPAENAGCPGAPEPVAPTLVVVDQINFIAKSVLFNTNKSTLRELSREKLDDIATIMREYPETHFVIEGHTDSVGDDAYNQTLSQQRAQSVVNYLKSAGVTNRLTAKGFGESNPIASNDTATGRAQNRRVVISLGN